MAVDLAASALAAHRLCISCSQVIGGRHSSAHRTTPERSGKTEPTMDAITHSRRYVSPCLIALAIFVLLATGGGARLQSVASSGTGAAACGTVSDCAYQVLKQRA